MPTGKTVILCASLVILSACDGDEHPTSPRNSLQSFAIQGATGGAAPSTIDDEFLSLEKSIPGFGGYYFDESGRRIIFLKDLGESSTARLEIDSHLNRRGGSTNLLSAPVEYRLGSFSFSDLFSWRQQLNESVFALEGVVFTDVDESSNGVRVGVTDEGTGGKVFSLATSLGIPSSAMRIELTDPIHIRSTLQDYVRPMEGGLMITSTRSCTLGFFAELSGQAVFITNSHCTNVTGGVEGTLFASLTIPLV